MKLRLKPLVALLAACPLYGFAADIPILDEIVVTTVRTSPQRPSVFKLGAPELAPMQASTSDAARLLRNIPGVNLYGAGGVSSLPSLHGLADDRLRIKVDGMDLISACANHMNSPLSYIDPTQVGDIGVFAGIAPVSTGGDSLGGSILVNSPSPEFARAGQGALLKGEAGAFYRSNGTGSNGTGGHLAATLANEKLSMSYQISTTKADNYQAGGDFKPAGLAAAGRDWLDANEVGGSKYKSTNQALKFGLRLDEHLVELKLGQQDIPYQDWPNQRMDMTGNDSTQINLRYQGRFDWGKLEARAYNEQTRHKMQFGDDKLYWYGPSNVPTSDGVPCVTLSGGMNGCAAGMPMDTEGDNTGFALKGDLRLSARDLIRVGGETQRYQLNDWWDPSGKGMWPDPFWNIRDGERDRLALFSEWEAQWNSRWLTQLGLRHETVDMNTGNVQGYSALFNPVDQTAFNAADHKKTDHNLDLTALARYTPNTAQTYEFGYAQKTRSPNLYERYAWSTHGMAMRMVNWAGDGNGYVGNLNLKPEVAHTLSATADWHSAEKDKWGLKVTPYFTRVDDYIDAARCSSGLSCTPANLTAKNAFVYLGFVNQSARLYGFDLSGHFALANTEGFGRFTATGILNYTEGKNETTDDNLYNIMPLNAKLAVVQKWASWTNTLELDLVSAKKEVSGVRNELETSGYGLVNLRGSYEWKQVRLDFGVENLLDRLYNAPLGGAYTGQGKTMSGTDVPWGVAVPGMGRSIYAGLKVKF